MRPCPRDWRYLLILWTSFTVCTMFVTSAYQFKGSDWYALGRLSISRYAILVRRYCTKVQLKTWVRVTEWGCELLNTRIDSTVLTHDKRWSVQLIKCPTSTQVPTSYAMSILRWYYRGRLARLVLSNIHHWLPCRLWVWKLSTLFDYSCPMYIRLLPMNASVHSLFGRHVLKRGWKVEKVPCWW